MPKKDTVLKVIIKHEGQDEKPKRFHKRIS